MDLHFVLLLIVALTATLLSRWRGWPTPLVLVATGAIASYVPVLPEVDIEPHVILTVVLPPLLYAASNAVFYLDLRTVIRPVLTLGVVMVGVTTLAVGVVAQMVVPSLTIASAMVLGAVVSPPDAVSTTALGRQARLPRRLMNILSGESLINDGMALTVLAVALAAASGETPHLGAGLWLFVSAVVVGAATGLVIAWCVHQIRTHLDDAVSQSLVSLAVPFVCYLLAEELGGSGVLAVVAAGLYLGHMQPYATYASRLHEEPLWDSVNLALEAGVFLLIGLQLRHVLDDVADVGVGQLIVSGAAVTMVVILVRPLFLFAVELVRRVPFMPAGADGPLPWRQNLVLSWAGMRGVVTLAAAAAIPAQTIDGSPFPGRSMIQYLAFVVTVTTLLTQGLTLPRVITSLGIADVHQARRDRSSEARLFELMKAETSRWLAVVHAQLVDDIGESAADQIVHHLDATVGPDATAAASNADRPRPPGKRSPSSSQDWDQVVQPLRREILTARREFIIAERDAGRLDEAVMRKVLRTLDLEEARYDSLSKAAQP